MVKMNMKISGSSAAFDEALETAKKTMEEYVNKQNHEAPVFYEIKVPPIKYWTTGVGAESWTYSHEASSSSSSSFGWTPDNSPFHVYSVNNDKAAGKMKLQSKIKVTIEPNPDGPYTTVTTKIEFADNFMEKFNGCTGDAATAIMVEVRKGVLDALADWNKELHKKGA